MGDTFEISPTRRKIISRFQSKITTEEDFNFDMLSAPPIYSMFTYQDIQELYSISSSTRLSGNPMKKKEKIAQVMARRGFTFKVSGTNRVTYNFLEDDRFLAKVAFDNVGREANINEFKNMVIFKPYVAKVFEVDPTGTLQICERVENFRYKVSYESLKDYIDLLKKEWFFGSYIWSDVGDNAWQNWGLRLNFGPVLLDYPTCVKLDPNKCKCNNVLPDGTFCGGDISIDAGFDKLFCTKCGYEYQISEVGTKIENNEIILDMGGNKMFDANVGFHGSYSGLVTEENNIYAPKEAKSITEVKDNPFNPKPMATKPVFKATTGKVKHNSNPKVRIPSQKDEKHDKKGYDRGYVKDNSQRNNGSRNKPKNDSSRSNFNGQSTSKNFQSIDLKAYEYLKEKYSELESEVEMAKADLFKYEENNIKLKESYEKLLEDKNSTTNDLMDQISNLQSTINEKDDIIINLNKQLEESKTEPVTETDTESVSELKAKIESLEQKLLVANEVTNTVRANLETRDNAYSELLKENEMLKTQTQKITENEVVVDRKEYNDSLASINQLTDTLEQSVLESAKLKSELSDSQHLINRLNDKIAALESQIEDNKKEFDNLKDEKEKIETELADMAEVQVITDKSPEDYEYAYKNDNMCALPAKLVEVRDIIEGSDSSDYVLVLHVPSDEEEYAYDPDGNIYVIDTIGGISLNDLTIITTEALNKIKALAEGKEVKNDTVSE